MIQQAPILTKARRRSPRKRAAAQTATVPFRMEGATFAHGARAACLLLAAVLLVLPHALAEEPPKGLLRELAANGSRFEQERGHYTYRQTFFFQEIGTGGVPGGFYREVREVVFSPTEEREEKVTGQTVDRLKRIRLTEEDFRDLRDVQPFVLTEDTLWQYEFTYKGREDLDGEDCFVFRMKPRQVLEGQRLLDGLIWVSSKHRQLVKAAGQPVPQIYRDKDENLFPQFATIYQPIDGAFWFPVKTVASDTLPFRTGPQQVKYTIEYENYRRFRAESTIKFDENNR